MASSHESDGVERPGDRQRRQRGEDATATASAAVERPERGARGSGQRGGAEQRAAGDEHDLHPGVRLELEPPSAMKANSTIERDGRR